MEPRQRSPAPTLAPSRRPLDTTLLIAIAVALWILVRRRGSPGGAPRAGTIEYTKATEYYTTERGSCIHTEESCPSLRESLHVKVRTAFQLSFKAQRNRK